MLLAVSFHPASEVTCDSGRPPMAPTKYRTQQLKAIYGQTLAQSAEIVALSATLPTANPTDFNVWTGLLYKQYATPKRVLNFTSNTVLLPTGTRIPGATITSIQVQKDGDNVNQYTMTAE